MTGLLAAERDRWTAAHCRVARVLFETCGAAGATTADPAASVALTAVSGPFAWHAALLYDLLPERQGIDREALVDQAIDGIDAALRVVADAFSRGATGVASYVLARCIVPRLRSSIDGALQSVSPALDGPRARALTLITRDLVDAQSILEPLCERLVAQPGALDEAAAAALVAEHHLIDDGVEVGIVQIGTRG